MPKLTQNVEVVEIELKSVEGGKLKMRTRMLAADAEKIYKQRKDGADQSSSLLFPLTLLVQEWNLTGEDDQPLPITAENLGLLGLEDVWEIYGKVEDLKRFLPQKV